MLFFFSLALLAIRIFLILHFPVIFVTTVMGHTIVSFNIQRTKVFNSNIFCELFLYHINTLSSNCFKKCSLFYDYINVEVNLNFLSPNFLFPLMIQKNFFHISRYTSPALPSKLKTFEKDQRKNEDDPSYLNKKFLCQPKTKTGKIGMHV